MNEAVGGAGLMQVGGAYVEHVIGSRQEIVAGNKMANKVGGDCQTEVTGQLTLTMGKDWKADVTKRSQTCVKENAAWLAKTFELKADKFSLIVNEKLILSIEKNGQVKLFAKALTLDGSEVKFKGSKVQLLGAGSLQDKSVKEARKNKLANSVFFKSSFFEG